MESRELVDYWIIKHNEKFTKYLFDGEPRYSLKTFFLNSYYLFETLGDEWEEYLESFEKLFRKDPSNDYYGYRDPLEADHERENALEWTTLYEIISKVGFPYNRSAKEKLLTRSTTFLEKAMSNPESTWVDFMLSSAVANLPECFQNITKWLPSQIKKYIQDERTPHHYMAYLNALKSLENQDELKEKITALLIDWIESPKGTPEAQIIIWARLITRLNWLPKIMESDIQTKINTNFLKTLDEVHSVEWHYSPMILEAYYKCTDDEKRSEILHHIYTEIAPSSYFKFYEIFPFIRPFDDAFDVKDEVQTIKEKCNNHPSSDMCKRCMDNKIGDCWIRIIAKVTQTDPKVHSGYEVADAVIYEGRKGVYIVMKADEIQRQRGEGDVLYRQCVSLFSTPYALVLYLNPYGTAPVVIEGIKKAAANSNSNSRFEVIDSKYVRQIYKKYKLDEESNAAGRGIFDFAS